MKIAYFDCFAGISGDMTLGALLDAGVDEQTFRSELAKLGDIGFDLKIYKVAKKGIQATKVDVLSHEHHHHRGLNDITEIIERSALSNTVKERSIQIFRRLAEAEGMVHGTTPDEVHFHEIGAVDAIVDIVGACIGIELLGIEYIAASPLPMGHGFVAADHGPIPLPAPAALEILKGVPVYPIGVEAETVTPTGAAILRTLASIFGEIPSMTIQSVGYGAGTRDLEYPNTLRIILGEQVSDNSAKQVSIVETNIDDMNPEFYDSVMEKLFASGALDVYITPIHMKKGRPAALLSAVCPTEITSQISDVFLRETSSFGVRISSARRRCLDRRWESVTTPYGDIRIKIGMLDGVQVSASPEYEDCKKAADVYGIPVRIAYEAALVKYHSH